MIIKFNLFEATATVPFLNLSLNEKWLLFYELEFKYNKIKNSFKNERQQNIFERIEKKLDSIVTTLIKTFLPVYNDYLIGHRGIYRHAKVSGEVGKKYVKQYENIFDLFDQANEIINLPLNKKIVLLERLKDAAHATNVMASHYQDIYNDVEANGFDFDNFEDLDVSEWEQELRFDGFIKESFELNFCADCMQMTNHKNGVCQKCLKPKLSLREFYDLLKADGYNVIDEIQFNRLYKNLTDEAEIYSTPIVRDNLDCIRLNKRRNKITISYHNIPFEDMEQLRKKYNYEIVL